MGAPIEFSNILGLEKPAELLIEKVSNAIGTLYEPTKIRKKADADAYRINKLTEAANNSGINGLIDLNDNKVLIETKEGKVIEHEEINQIVKCELIRLLKEKENLIKIADFAYEELEDSDIKTDKEIDEDWLNDFFDKGKKIYREDLQFIFGKILAGEIRQPGTFSKRLLSIICTLSTEEAQIFKKISKLAFSGKDNKLFVIADTDILKKYDIKVDDILMLEEAGLINSTVLMASGRTLYKYNNHLIDFCNQKPKLRVHIFTKVGCELNSILSNEPDMKYIIAIKQRYSIEKVNYSHIISETINDHSVEYELDSTIELK